MTLGIFINSSLGMVWYDCDCVQGEGGTCSNCGVACTVTHVTPKGALCNSCYQHWRYVKKEKRYPTFTKRMLFMSIVIFPKKKKTARFVLLFCCTVGYHVILVLTNERGYFSCFYLKMIFVCIHTECSVIERCH